MNTTTEDTHLDAYIDWVNCWQAAYSTKTFTYGDRTFHVATIDPQPQSNLPPYDPTWVDPALSIPRDDHKTQEQIDRQRAIDDYNRAMRGVI